MRGRGAPEESMKEMWSFGEEASQGKDSGRRVHSKVHKGAGCAKCQGLAPERAHEELVRGEERGGPPEPNTRMNSSGGEASQGRGAGVWGQAVGGKGAKVLGKHRLRRRVAREQHALRGHD